MPKGIYKKCPVTDHTEISLRGQFKLAPHLRWSPLGVLFEFSDEHPRHFYMGVPPGNVSFRGIFLLRPVWLPRVCIVLYSLSLAEIVKPKGTREREEVRNTLK